MIDSNDDVFGASVTALAKTSDLARRSVAIHVASGQQGGCMLWAKL
jgi:hypothetical protein